MNKLNVAAPLAWLHLGRSAAGHWLDTHFDAIGNESTLHVITTYA